MGSSISPIVANLFMEEFEIKIINIAINTPRIWLTHVNDTSVIQKAEYSNQFPQQINSTDPHIQFTAKTPKTDGSILFLDTLVSTVPDNTPANSLQETYPHRLVYLWDSDHNLSSKYSVFNTLTYRARTVYSNLQLLHREKEHINGALQRCKYPNWALNRLKNNHNHNTKQAQKQHQQQLQHQKQPHQHLYDVTCK